jgi:hypothetical protein
VNYLGTTNSKFSTWFLIHELPIKADLKFVAVGKQKHFQTQVLLGL